MRARSSNFERALKIELLRARAALERDVISGHANQFKQSIDPRQQIAHWLPQSSAGLLGQVSQLTRFAFRYPYLLSSGASLVASQVRHPKRLMVIGVTALLVWASVRYRKTD